MKKPAVMKKPSKRMALHGSLIGTHLSRNEALLRPLPDEVTQGSAPGTPESSQEVKGRKASNSEHVTGSDAGSGLQAVQRCWLPISA